MAGKKLFKVKYEAYAVVYAEDENEAEEIAADHDFDILADSGDSRAWSASALVGRGDLPPGWLDYSFVLDSKENDMTVGELLDAQHNNH